MILFRTIAGVSVGARSCDVAAYEPPRFPDHFAIRFRLTRMSGAGGVFELCAAGKYSQDQEPRVKQPEKIPCWTNA